MTHQLLSFPIVLLQSLPPSHKMPHFAVGSFSQPIVNVEIQREQVLLRMTLNQITKDSRNFQTLV
jgi:hypothetical protein